MNVCVCGDGVLGGRCVCLVCARVFFFYITLQVQSALEVLSEQALQHKAALQDKVQTRQYLGCMQYISYIHARM